MFHRLGKTVAQHWALVILLWMSTIVSLKVTQSFGLLPRWDDVTYDGDLDHLPSDMPSVRGAELVQQGFPEDEGKSQIVLVVARPDAPLTPHDMVFSGHLATAFREKIRQENLPIVDVWTHRSKVVGRMLTSRDRQAVLIVLQLDQEFMATENVALLSTVREELRRLAAEQPTGLKVGITGSAAIGGDMLSSAAESIRNTETFAIILVTLILLIVYRAPLLVIIPLATIAASLSVAMDFVALLTELGGFPGFNWFGFKIFTTTKIFVVVILYGAGTDYCLFLVARYKEELSRGLPPKSAVAESLGHVGEALTASALTTIAGLVTMVFAAFGKFQSSGPAIAICLAVALIACLTLAPALLRLGGKVVFWPFGVPTPKKKSSSGKTSDSLFAPFWQRVSTQVLVRPGTILVCCLILLLVPAYHGTSIKITYDLLGELRHDRPSVQGTKLLQQHFSPGETGPLTLLAVKVDGDFDTAEGERHIAHLTKFLYDIDGVTSVRSTAEPMGNRPGYVQPFSKAGLIKMAAKRHRLTKARFVAQAPEWKGNVARFDLVLDCDPFSREAIALLERIDKSLQNLMAVPGSVWNDTEFEYVGTTAAIRDLKMVTESDRQLIERLVVLAVLAVLVIILRRPLVCIYLILSVLLSYFATIGVTELFFQWFYGTTYHGLDWKVPLFLFVILIAVGQDYNIYLTTRIFEEQKRLGPRAGLQAAVIQTGGIITSCGVIMAGTFVSMMTGTLRGMLELGFALTLGVLLDTFLVRTLLVPAFFSLIDVKRLERSAARTNTPTAPTGPS